MGSPAYPTSPYFVASPDPETMAKLFKHHAMMEDWIIGELFSDNTRFFTSLSEKITMSPDVIFVEQPWLFRFAERLNLERFCNHAKILYGSQNIEHHLKAGILKRYYGERHVLEASEKVLQCELHAISRAERTFCVSQNDVAWTRTHTTNEPILATNGVIDRRASMADIAAANRITHGRKFALYCASGHPPNIEGFFDIFGNGAGCIPPEARMVVAGEAGRLLAADPRLGRTGTLERQFIDAGQVSESVLRGLLATAHVMILPITSGGGTNLKTAEALWSGHHIIATSAAMRGFEQFSSARGIQVTDESASFLNAMREAFLQPNLQIDLREREERNVVLWEHTLSHMMENIDAMEPLA